MLDFITLGFIVIDLILEFNVFVLEWLINPSSCIKDIESYINRLINVY